MIVATYDYLGADGARKYQVVRLSPKAFRQRRPDGAGGWIWKMAGVERVPYRLPQMLAAPTSEAIWICEGERDVDRLVRLGFVATCNSGGAGKFGPELVRWFKGRHVVVVADQDEAGWLHCFRVAHLLHHVAASVRVVDILPEKDVSALAEAILSKGGDTESVRMLLEALADRDEMVLDDWAPVPNV